MAKINIDGVQNAEVSIKIPCEKTPQEQLEIMEEYTRVYQESLSLDKAKREINCLKVIYPTLFRSIEETDLIAGRLDFLPIGFGCVTSVGGVGHYCVFHKLRAFKETLSTDEEKKRVDVLYGFWQDHDVKALYCQDILNETTTGRFIDCKYPFMATARLSGMMLDYPFFLFVLKAKETASSSRSKDLDLMYESLDYILENKPKTFHQALQLFWIYALCAGVINYGRMDIVLGPYLKRDIDEGRLTEDEAYRYLKSLWLMIENRRTTVNGLIIVGYFTF